MKFISENKKIVIAFFVIIVLSCVFRFLFLGSGEIMGDEPAYSVRSIGWLDTLNSGVQTTPIDWFSEWPWWSRLSFHDHPPLTFAINFVFYKTFGSDLADTRIPSAFFGVLSVILIFFMGKKMFNDDVAIFGMALFGVNCSQILFSRVCMMESITLFFILLALYVFLHVLENSRYLPIFGICLGFSFLAKYVAFAMVPVYIIMLLIYKREYFKNRRLYLSILLCIAVFSPVIIYNIEMYRAVGHFDLQFSYIFGQHTPEWISQDGKNQIGGLNNRLWGLTNFLQMCAIPTLFLTMSCLAGWAVSVCKKRGLTRSDCLLFLVLVIFLMSFILLFGSAVRFVYYLIFVICFLASSFAVSFRSLFGRRYWVVLLCVCLSFEFLFSINTIIAPTVFKPIGFPIWTYSRSLVVYDQGIQKLEEYFINEIDSKIPDGLILSSNKISRNNFIKKYASKYDNMSDSSKNARIIIFYDPRLDFKPLFWSLAKRTWYGGWPVFSLKSYSKMIDLEYINNSASVFYYVTGGTSWQELMPSDEALYPNPASFIGYLDSHSVENIKIYNKQHQDTFLIYKFDYGIAKGFASEIDKLKSNKNEYKK